MKVREDLLSFWVALALFLGTFSSTDGVRYCEEGMSHSIKGYQTVECKGDEDPCITFTYTVQENQRKTQMRTIKGCFDIDTKKDEEKKVFPMNGCRYTDIEDGKYFGRLCGCATLSDGSPCNTDDNEHFKQPACKKSKERNNTMDGTGESKSGSTRMSVSIGGTFALAVTVIVIVPSLLTFNNQ